MRTRLVVTLGLVFVLLSMSTVSMSQRTTAPNFIHHVEDGITLETSYQVSMDFSNWLITANKAVDMEVRVTQNIPNAVILVEHMHADVFIESNYTNFDDALQDSMDDSMHGIQGGFLINSKYTYKETFSIEGKSPQFTSFYYMQYGSYYGAGESKTYKLSEKSLREYYGVYGQTIYIVFDIMIKYPADTYFHKTVISDNIFIDLEGEMVGNQGNRQDNQSKEASGFGLLVTMAGLIAGSALYARKRRTGKWLP